MTRQLSDFERQAAVFKALAHPARLYLLEVLSGGEQCVCDLTEMVGSDISTVSRHLTQLKRVGIVASEKQGQKVIYRLACPCVTRFVECVDSKATPTARQPIRLGELY